MKSLLSGKICLFSYLTRVLYDNQSKKEVEIL